MARLCLLNAYKNAAHLRLCEGGHVMATDDMRAASSNGVCAEAQTSNTLSTHLAHCFSGFFFFMQLNFLGMENSSFQNESISNHSYQSVIQIGNSKAKPNFSSKHAPPQT